MVARGEIARFWSLESLHMVASDGGAESSALVDDNGSEEDFSYEELCQANPRYLQPGGEQLAINELISDGSVVCAEALWDHVTMDDQELGFKAGDVIQVLEASNKDWWWGRNEDKEAWFPASFVRLRVNQEELPESCSSSHGEEQDEDTSKARHKHTESQQQMRTNVIQEIMNLTWDFWVILKTNVFLKAIIAFDFEKKSVCLYKFYYQIPEFYKKSKTLSIMFSFPNLLLGLRHVLYFERKKRKALAQMESDAQEQHSLPLPEWAKKDWRLKF